MEARASVCVVGSVNTDILAALERFPAAGETIAAKGFKVSGGGKGANQAVALAKLGTETRFVAKLGSDAFGRDRLADLFAAGIEVSTIGIEEGADSGIALVETDMSGQNRIVIVAGANALVDESFVESRAASIASASMALFQLEIPLSAVSKGLAIAQKGGALTMLDPAPAQALPPGIYPLLDYLTPNETETEILTGIAPRDAESAAAAAACLLGRGARNVIIKAGKQGAYLFSSGLPARFCPAFPVQAVDSTAAGDAFNAGFAAALASGKSEAEALRFSCAVGALATTRRGAQEAMPTLAEVESLLRAHPEIQTRIISA